MNIIVSCPCGADLNIEDTVLVDAVRLMDEFVKQHPCDSRRADERMAYFADRTEETRGK